MSALRIFSYLPNPRVWKATIAARLCGVELEVVGAAPEELPQWLWDFDARPLSPEQRGELEPLARAGQVGLTTRLYKTEAFLAAHPFGTVPAAFSPDGKTGIFESNSIMRAVARLGAARFPLYGGDAYEAARIDGFLDAGLGFARDAQLYLLDLRGGAVDAELYARTAQAFASYLRGIERALAPPAEFIAGAGLTLADIGFVAELALFHSELAHRALLEKHGLRTLVSSMAGDFPRALAHFDKLRRHPAFAPDVEPYLKKFETP